MTEKEFYKEVTKDMVTGLDVIKTNITVTPVRSKRKRPSIAASVFLCIILFGGIGTVAAFSYHKWSTGLQSAVDTTDKAAKELEKDGYFNDYTETVVSDTVNGVTISVKQSLIDNYFAHVIFSVSGIELTDKEICPSFEDFSITVGGGKYSICHEFYEYYDDEQAEDGSLIPHFVLPDGTLEYHAVMHITYDNDKGTFINNSVHAEFRNLTLASGYEITGKWTLDWNFGGCDKTVIKKFENRSIGEYTADNASREVFISEVEYSPISMKVVYYVEDGMEGIERDDLIPGVYGVKMKDGTIQNIGGQSGYGGPIGEKGFKRVYSNMQAIDVDNIDSILFLKDELRNSIDDEYTDNDYNYIKVSQ